MFETVVYTTAAALSVAFGIGSGVHALLHKRDPRAQLGWVIICLLLPPLGAAAYWLMGVNRIRTRARRWQERGLFEIQREGGAYDRAAVQLSSQHPEMAETLAALLKISARVTRRPLLGGNKVEPLFNGEQAYPAMLEAIEGARSTILLCTYLFDTDAAGRRFVDALGAAAERGVEVRVLVDGFGEHYSHPPVGRLLRRRGVRVGRFLPLSFGARALWFNLRNHRKLLVVDGEVGFTGGMNIGQRHMVTADDNPKRTADVHFRVSGPAVYALEEVFLEDWQFATGDKSEWSGVRQLAPQGQALCRGIKDGPNEDFERLTWVLVGALASARRRVRIMTPYFVPSREILAGLNAAVLRGVEVEIILPERSNLRFVDWATRAMLAEVMQYGIRVYLQPPPFCHGKIFIADDFYVLVGSANMDPRSLRLNFEFNLEVYDPGLGATMAGYFEEVKSRSREIGVADLDGRSFGARFRDACAKLFSPYL